MARPRSTTPTPGEMEIMRVIWAKGPAPVKAVHETLRKNRPVALTTVASMMQLMEGKSLLKLVDQNRPFRYEAGIDADAAKDSLLKEIANRAFNGSARSLVMHLLSKKPMSKDKAAQVEKLLEHLD